MFLAGLELDLSVFARFRNRAIGFTVLTFASARPRDDRRPSSSATSSRRRCCSGRCSPRTRSSCTRSFATRACGERRGGDDGRRHRAHRHDGVDLAGRRSGSTTGDANGVELLLQILLGLALLAGYCFAVLPHVASWFFRGIGTPRPLRYLFILASLLSAGVLGEMVGIEAIVGAFFAGLALNRLVPNEGEFMERIEFFGSALLVPMFLVSVGTVIDPAVLVDLGTLGLAAVFTVACVGGKLLAALLCKPLFGYTTAEAGVVFGLSVAQAAATLAATFVGLQIGLFTSSTVNTVMIVIVVSLVLASTAAQRFGARIAKPVEDSSAHRAERAHPRVRPRRCAECARDRVADRLRRRGSGAAPAHRAGRGSGAYRARRSGNWDMSSPDSPSMPSSTFVTTERRPMVCSTPSSRCGRRSSSCRRRPSRGCRHCSAPASTRSWPRRRCRRPSSVPAMSHRAVPCWCWRRRQARRPASAANLAGLLSMRLRRSGLEVIVVAATEPVELITSVLGDTPCTVEPPQQWLEREGRPDDVIVVPGGRNGALATARTTKLATTKGCSILVVADRDSVSASDRAAEGLGLVTGRPSPS